MVTVEPQTTNQAIRADLRQAITRRRRMTAMGKIQVNIKSSKIEVTFSKKTPEAKTSRVASSSTAREVMVKDSAATTMVDISNIQEVSLTMMIVTLARVAKVTKEKLADTFKATKNHSKVAMETETKMTVTSSRATTKVVKQEATTRIVLRQATAVSKPSLVTMMMVRGKMMIVVMVVKNISKATVIKVSLNNLIQSNLPTNLKLLILKSLFTAVKTITRCQAKLIQDLN